MLIISLPLFQFGQMEGLVREMQDPENGVPVRSQKLFLTSIPSAFMGQFITYISDIHTSSLPLFLSLSLSLSLSVCVTRPFLCH